MANFLKCLVWTGVVCFLFLNSCTTDTRLEYEILHVEGVTWGCNVSASYSLFGSSSESEDQPEIRIPVSDGDLLYMVNENESGLYHRFRVEDGNHMVVSHDTAKPHLVFINGRLSQIELTGETDFGALDSELLATPAGEVMSLLLGDTLSDELFRKLEDLMPKLEGTGIFIDMNVTTGQFNKLLSICSPEWVASESILPDPATDQLEIFSNLELLWITGESLGLLPMEQCCNNLETLIIADWDPETGEILPLSGLRKCHTLALVECGLSDLSAIQFPHNLQRLHLVGCDTLVDISRISEIPHLVSLGLAGSDDVADLEPVKKFSELKRIAFPSNISQEDFTAVVDQIHYPEVIELIECEDVVDLNPLAEKESLKILAIYPGSEWPANLGSLNQLELVILSADIFENSPELIAELRQQLPNTLVVPGSGLCMGSGWLLLLVPLILLSRFLFKRR